MLAVYLWPPSSVISSPGTLIHTSGPPTTNNEFQISVSSYNLSPEYQRNTHLWTPPRDHSTRSFNTKMYCTELIPNLLLSHLYFGYWYHVPKPECYPFYFLPCNQSRISHQVKSHSISLTQKSTLHPQRLSWFRHIHSILAALLTFSHSFILLLKSFI